MLLSIVGLHSMTSFNLRVLGANKKDKIKLKKKKRMNEKKKKNEGIFANAVFTSCRSNFSYAQRRQPADCHKATKLLCVSNVPLHSTIIDL